MKLPKLTIGDLTLDLPIIQGGMGVAVSKASLATAVSSEGGLGVIASVGLGESTVVEQGYDKSSSTSLRTEIRKVTEKGVPVGVNIMVALSNFQSLVEVCAEENVDVIIAGAGLPLRMPAYVGKSTVKLVPIVSSARAAQIIYKTWLRKYDRLPDAIVIEGPAAGGHLGFKFTDLETGTAESLESILQGVLPITQEYEKQYNKKIPLIVAGGIYTGQDIAKFLSLGASGVQMGTRFVATHECDTSDEYKQVFVDATEDDVVLVHSPVGLPARVIKNAFINKSIEGTRFKFSCPYKCLLTCEAKTANYCLAAALLNAANGDFDNGFAMCGENVHRIDKIVSVKELMQELVDGAEQYTG